MGNINLPSNISADLDQIKYYHGMEHYQENIYVNSTQNNYVNNTNQHLQDNIQLSITLSQLKSPIKQQYKQNNQDHKNIQNYQKISDLYPQLANWRLLGRLIKKNYNQFVSNKGKLTKLLNLEIIDVNGMKICGTLFGDCAKSRSQALKEQSVYIFSKALIKEQYSQNKGKNYSKYELAFNTQSTFELCKDNNIIPHSHQCDLLYISQNKNKNELFDIVAILLSIKQQIQIHKDNKMLYKQSLVICDPINNLLIDAVIWNRTISIDQKYIGKTIGLYGFKLNQFHQKLQLNSSFNSQIKLLQNHKYSKYEHKIQKQKLKIIPIQQQQKTQEIQQQPYKNLKQLQNDLIHLQKGKQLKSTLYLNIGYINWKNWCYQSCPYCRRKAQVSTICNFCQKDIKQTIVKYKLVMELNDYSSCIRAVGFDEFGIKLFQDIPKGIKGIIQMTEQDRHKQFELKQNSEYIFKIISKRQKDTNFIYHTINKISNCNFLIKTKDNIKRIKNYL